MIHSQHPAIQFRGVTRTFADGDRAVTALDDVTFHVPRESVFGVVGESGAGKSTLLRHMNGLDHPTRGAVLFDGVNLATLTKRELNQTRRRIGVVFQSFNLVANLTVRQNIALPLKLQRETNPGAWTSSPSLLGCQTAWPTFPLSSLAAKSSASRSPARS